MISVEEAYNQVLSKSIPSHNIQVSIDEAAGRYLAEDIHADQDFPPFNRVMMDGIALDHKLADRGSLPVSGIQTAGAPQMTVPEGHCIEVMTGSILPLGADAVIPYEQIRIENGTAHLPDDSPVPLRHVHLKGTDRRQGDLLIPAGRQIGPPEIAILATVGKSSVKVVQLEVAVVSTGDELVDIDQTPHPYQIRRSNGHTLQALIRGHGFSATLYHIEDDMEGIKKTLGEILDQHAVVILSGGVSRGKKDYVPGALDALQVEKQFHRVAQRPGKPFWFGVRDERNVVFALPGNPVSTFLCYHRYVNPWLIRHGGGKMLTQTAILGEDYQFEPDLTCYLQVRIADDNGQRVAFAQAGKGSGDLANLLEADGFLELPAGRDEFEAGESFEYLPFR